MGKVVNTIVIQTALPLEQKAVVAKLTNIHDYIHPLSNTIYKVGNLISNGNLLQIIVGKTNQTNINAGIETERIIQHFTPTYIFFVGVAGGLKDVKVGDVVIGTDVYGYERGKAKNEFFARPQFGFSSSELEQKAVNYSNSAEWRRHSSSLVDRKFHNEILVYPGTIASGEKVVGSFDSELYRFLQKECSHALAVEMEGLGFLEACRPYPLIKSLLIRGISDLINEKENSDSKGSQPYAAKNATEFLFGLIDFIGISQEIETLSLRQKLSEIAPKLYPSGMRDNGIWDRAGGDLSFINLTSNGKTQWIEALDLIEKGGGGYISFLTLVREMRIDFPNNDSLKKL
jgi:nucleoside phosphorylase